MATRKQTGKSPTKRKARAPRKKVSERPTQEELEVRRERVKELWGKSDRRIARILIDEGFFKPPQSRLAIDQAKFEESCRRNVTNDRAAVRAEWRKKKLTRTEADITESMEDYVARLEMRIEELDELLDDKTLKHTPRMLAMSEIRQLEALRAKALGSAEITPPAADDDGPQVPFVGLLLDLSDVSPELRKKIHGRGRKRDDEDGDDG